MCNSWLLIVLLGLFCLGGKANNLSSEENEIPSSGHLSTKFDELFHQIFFPVDDKFGDLLCSECIATLTSVRTAYREGVPLGIIEKILIVACTNLGIKYFPHDFCEGLVRLEGASLAYILNTTNYDMGTCCGYILGESHCNKTELEKWSITVPGGKPEPDDPEPILPAANTIRILHITDTHTNFDYDEGSSVWCDHPFCCRHEFGDPEPGDPVAGHWGATEGMCEGPLRTTDELIRQASLMQPDLVYITGDLPSAYFWEKTQESNIATMNTTMLLLKKYMPDIPILNILGNHEAVPFDSFAVPAVYDAGFSMDWLYESCVEMWSEWLPEDTFDDIRRGGFYSYSPFPGFRVINVNINYCDSNNLWLLVDNEDPTGQLQWLIDTLGEAETAGEKVHILSHFPPGHFCEDSWNIAFNNVITRYESTIRAMFFGHWHYDALSLVYDPLEPLRPVALGITGPEASSMLGNNPAFKMYTVDANHEKATWSIIDMQTYTMNMTNANEPEGVPEFLERYTSQESYGVDTLTAASVDQLILDMAADKDLFAQYIRNKYNHYLEPPLMFTCPEDPDCYKRELCWIVNTDHHIRDACQHIEEIIDGGLLDSP